jgi:hypothetical protein
LAEYFVMQFVAIDNTAQVCIANSTILIVVYGKASGRKHKPYTIFGLASEDPYVIPKPAVSHSASQPI